jgi:hypothetical protein
MSAHAAESPPLTVEVLPEVEEISVSKKSEKKGNRKIANPEPGKFPVFFKSSFDAKKQISSAQLDFTDFIGFADSTRDLIGTQGSRVNHPTTTAHNALFSRCMAIALINQLGKAALEEGSNSPLVLEASRVEVDLPATYVQAAAVIGVADCYGQTYAPAGAELQIARLLLYLRGLSDYGYPAYLQHVSFSSETNRLIGLMPIATEATFQDVIGLSSKTTIGTRRTPIHAVVPYPNATERVSAYIARLKSTPGFNSWGIKADDLDKVVPKDNADAEAAIRKVGASVGVAELCRLLSEMVALYTVTCLPHVQRVCKVLNTKRLSGYGSPAMFAKLAGDTIECGAPLQKKHTAPAVIFAPFRSKMLARFAWPAPVHRRSVFAAQLANTVLRVHNKP